MGKKKSKTAKQKQVTKKFGGLSVKKGGGREQGTVVLAPTNKAKAPLKKSAANKRLRQARPENPNKSGLLGKKDEFRVQMKSMQERNTYERINKNKGKAKSLQLAPATLITNDKSKSTQQLVGEATTQIHGMNGIGQQQQQFQQFPFTPSNRLQVMAAQIHDAWTEEESPLEADNPYASLHQADSDDEEEQQTKKAPLFQFAPASFGLPSTTIDDDLDPDL